MADSACQRWDLLPDCILVELFSFLNWRELSVIAQTCRSWSRVSYDEQLWRAVFHRDWKVGRRTELAPNATSWRQEYRRLVHETPRVLTDTVREHEVVHVSFSHDGRLFASCSKDGYVKIWNAEYPVTIRYSQDMKEYEWVYPHLSLFNDSDTLLLVTGTPHSGYSAGEIVVFSLEDEMEFRCRVKNDAKHVKGFWYNDEFLINGNFYHLGENLSRSVLYLTKASQESDSEHKSVMSKLFHFYNPISELQITKIANCVDGETSSSTKREDPNRNDRGAPSCAVACKEDDESEILLDKRDKYLIYLTTKLKSNVLHEIGFKRISPLRFKERMNLNLEDSLAEHRQRDIDNNTRELPNWNDEESVRSMFADVDDYIDLHGLIIGIGLSPDHRYLYVNCRSWPEGYRLSDTNDSPPIAQEIEIHVIDMLTLSEVGTKFRSHKAFTPAEDHFDIHLDVSDNYVASGSEDGKGYLWDRHYGMCVSRFQHDNIISCVAFNPCDQEVLVTASDCHTLKVWRSKRLTSKIREKGTQKSL